MLDYPGKDTTVVSKCMIPWGRESRPWGVGTLARQYVWARASHSLRDNLARFVIQLCGEECALLSQQD